MPTILLRVLFFALACALAGSALVRTGGSRAFAETEPLLVVASLAFPGSDITLSDLKTAFRGQRAISGGKVIVPINHNAGTPLRVEFDMVVLGLDQAAVGRYWVDRRIRDEGSPPKSVPSAELAVRVVAAIPTAITYARRALLTPKVKVLTVDGKTAERPGYALVPPR